jgi:hypothetical protein
MIRVGLIPANLFATMQRQALTLLILALGVALPAQASHVKKPTVKTEAIKPVAVASQPLAQAPTCSKGTRLVASTMLPGGKPAPKIAAAKPAAPAPAIAAAPASGMPATNPVVPVGCLARLTAYWTEEDPWTAKHESSTGVRLQEGHCAVDPKLIPYGSLVQIPGMGSYVAVDTGSAVISRQAALGSGQNAAQRNALVVDLFFENRKEAEDFAAHGPAYVAVSWAKPLTAIDCPNNPRALPAIPTMPAGTVYVLAEAPSMADMRMPMAFRTPQL